MFKSLEREQLPDEPFRTQSFAQALAQYRRQLAAPLKSPSSRTQGAPLLSAGQV
ncbi:MAG: hypothetical protein LBQ49_01540 [Rickettsiales bacterium]|jgi:hypothetical protein|nr:hypothetical protein [Rickettsiales bacterium]